MKLKKTTYILIAAVLLILLSALSGPFIASVYLQHYAGLKVEKRQTVFTSQDDIIDEPQITIVDETTLPVDTATPADSTSGNTAAEL